MLAAGFAVFFAAYFVYSSTYLGHIDSLPPLPQGYLPREERGRSLDEERALHANALAVILSQNQPLASAACTSIFLLYPIPQTPTNHLDELITQAFGPGCVELKRAYRLYLAAKNMVLSAESCNFVNGTIQMSPVSIALFGKEKGDGKGREINTIRADNAVLTFDRPVNNMNEVSGRKLVEAEMRGDIVLVNNRRTLSRVDDLEVYIRQGPLYYNEPKHLVWTRDNVHLVDKQSQPDPIDIRGEGMEMELVTETPPAKGGAPPSTKNRNETISGVKRIELHANVHMHLYSNGSGMMGGKKPEPATTAPREAKGKGPKPAAAPREHVYIHTPGRFRYDFLKDHDFAQFDVPAGGAAGPQDVEVIRDHGKDSPTDMLFCQHLELRLKHRDNTPPPPGLGSQPAHPAAGQDAEQSLEIETVHAIDRRKELILTSDVEKLEASGTDFFYDATRKLTLLRGSPEIRVVKDRNVLHAREMQMRDVKAPPRPGQPPEVFQEVIAPGPGSIHMPSKGKEKSTTHAYWTDRLISTRDGPNDLLVLIGNARFLDDEHDQSLQGETLKVWLLPEDPKKKEAPARAPKPAPKPGEKKSPAPTDITAEHGRKPHHIEANKAVVAHSPDLNVHDCERLVLWFKDVAELPSAPQPEKPPLSAAPPARPAAPVAPPPPGSRTPMPPIAPPSPPQVGKPVSAGPVLGPPAPPPKPANRPVDLSARFIEAWVLRADDRSQLDELRTRGKVHVHQEPAKPDEKPVDIHGSTLNMNYRPEGNLLVVSGEEGEDNDLAQLQMDKIYIIGPTVNIDQRDNVVWVDGVGAMQMESATNFQGSKLDRPVPLTVHWNERMYFDGISAEFLGNIQAEQQNSRLACKRLQVFFDRPISLKDGHQSDQPAKVRTLNCTDKVRVEDVSYVRDELEKYQLIRGRELEMRTVKPDEDEPRIGTQPPAEGNEVEVVGPGDVRILQRGGVDATPGAPPAARTDAGRRGEAPGRPVSVARNEPARRRPGPGGAGAAAGGKDELTMTYVRFGQRMLANSKTNKASFYEAVEVLHFPWDGSRTLHEEFDIPDILARGLPEGWMYLRCNRLLVVDQKEGGVSHQQMEANGRVQARTPEFLAESTKMTYDQQKDLVVFYGRPGVPAQFTKYGGKGQILNEFTGQMIAYSRATGKCQVDGVETIKGH
jgi:hypothetical protein